MENFNQILMTDSYKETHHAQYPAGTTRVYSYFESRVGAKYDVTPFIGLQYILKKYLEGSIITMEKIKEAEELIIAHFGDVSHFNRKMWEYIVNEHGGNIPLVIKAVPEGLPIPTSNALMTIENTDPNCAALTNHFETILTHCWYPSTVAALSRYCKVMMKKYLSETSDNPGALNFQLHDFGYRGTSSIESAGIGGFAHICNFFGTDTIRAMEIAKQYYGAPTGAGSYSVPATEHSVMTSMGPEGEAELTERIIRQYPVGILSLVGDSYNIENFVTNIIGKRCKDIILKRNHPKIPCKVVVRPDSLRSKTDTPESQMVWIANALWEVFGGTVNSKGFKVLDSHVGMLWGDGIDVDGIHKILQAMKDAGYSTENVVFGMGGGLLQKVNRDTQRFAFKAVAMERDGKWIDIYKKPLDESKASKKGRLRTVSCGDGSIYTIPESSKGGTDLLQTVFLNGKLVKEYSLDDIRKNCQV